MLLSRRSDSGTYGCADPSFILQDCSDVQWYYDGPMGYGWYCAEGGKRPLKKNIYDGKSVTYAPDLYKVGKKWYPYVNSCIHLDCEAGIGYNKDYGIWQCCDDMNWQYC